MADYELTKQGGQTVVWFGDEHSGICLTIHAEAMRERIDYASALEAELAVYKRALETLLGHIYPSFPYHENNTKDAIARYLEQARKELADVPTD